MSATSREFADILSGMRKVVISDNWASTRQRPVINGDLVTALRELKRSAGDGDILLACGPKTLGPLISAPNLVDEYVIAVHPAVLFKGPQLFESLSRDLALELVAATPFDGGVVVLHHRVVEPRR